MTSFHEAIQYYPSISTILTRPEFSSQGESVLNIFERLDQATWWCELKWRKEGIGYRRYIDADARTVTFHFADHDVARHFNNVFGKG